MMEFPKLDAAIAAGAYTLWECDTKSMIHEAERALGVTLPPSFREFSLRYGQINVGEACTGGARVAQAHTPYVREEYGLPAQYIVFKMEHGDIAMWALDTSRPRRDGEYPVVLIDFTESGEMSFDAHVDAHVGQPVHDLAADFHTFVERSAESRKRRQIEYAAIAKRSAVAKKGAAKAKAAKKAAGKSTKVSKKGAAATGRKVVKKQTRKPKSTGTSARKRVKAARRKLKR
ncbi:MAG: SMI1/KNR4 family protein [Planctomycetaceae bacterium]|nr:SMI1/KNR4 family protein [Planctomycetaceae bacterium]